MKITRALAKMLGVDMPKGKKKKIVTGEPPSVKLFLKLCAAHGLAEPIPEYPFAESLGRKWRVDFLFEGWLALEVEGGVWTQGRHTRGQGFLDDICKYNELTILGYALLRCTPEDLSSGAACALVKRALDASGEQS